jgi:hypothetical protein
MFYSWWWIEDLDSSPLGEKEGVLVGGVGWSELEVEGTNGGIRGVENEVYDGVRYYCRG